MVLLVGAALFVRSLQHVERLPMGYDAEHVLLVTRVLRGEWPGDSAMTQMSRLLLAEAQALPGVESAAWVNSTPFVSTSASNIYVAGIDSVAPVWDVHLPGDDGRLFPHHAYAHPARARARRRGSRRRAARSAW